MKKIRYREAGKTVTLYSPAGRTESFGFTGMFFLPHSAPPYRYIMQIEGVIAAVIVVDIPSAVAVVPHLLHLLHSFGTLMVEFLQKSGVCFLTVMLSVHLNFY